MVSLEFGLLLPLVALLLVLVLQVVGVAKDVLVVQDLARRAARVAAVEDDASVRVAVTTRLPDAQVRIQPRSAGPGSLVSVTVARHVDLGGRQITVSGRGTAMVEPGRP